MPKRTTSRTKPTGLMAAFANTQRQQTTLVGDIQAHAVKKSAQDHSRRQDIIHPSEMAKPDVCPRAVVYRLSGVTPTEDKDPNGHHLEMIFQEGHDIHTKWQTWLAEMGRLWGKWECRVCGTEEWGVSGDLPVAASWECNGGYGHTWEYREVSLDAEDELMMVGHADGAVPDLQAFIEIKSIGLGTLRMEEPDLVREHTVKTVEGKSVVDYDSLWKAIKRPLRSHRIQAGIYLHIAALKGWDYDRMIFIYENKANQQTKEFVIKYPADLIDPIIDMVKDIKWAVENDRVLDRPEGFTKQLKPCTSCVFRSHCYSGDDTEGKEEDGKDSDTQRDVEDGAGEPRSEAATRSTRDPGAEATTGRLPRASGRPHRTVRQRTDVAVPRDEPVERVPRRAEGHGGGGRKVRRSRTR